MATFTVSVPDELKKEMDKHPEINWAEYLKKRFEIRLKEFQKFEELKNSGKLYSK
jgi:predicted metal-dependent peptidase